MTLLLQRLADLYQGDDFAFLIVDDESPDGTAHRVRDFARNDRRVHLLEGQRRGLGHAYVRGIAHALEALGAQVVVQMDADFSHDPADASRLLARLADGADVAIGSRYIPGGSLDENWSVGRRLLSRWGNYLARWIAGLATVHDCTAGFKAIRADVLRAAKVEKIRVQGYAFQVVLLHRMLHVKARVVEEPIYFRERERGSTKLGAKDIFEFFYNVWWMRLISHRTFIKFALVGLSGVFINLGSFQVMLDQGVHRFLASPVAIELSIISNFLLNNYWTFAERVMVGRKRIRGITFNLLSLLAVTLSSATFVVLSMLFPDIQPVWLQGCSILPPALFSYFVSSYWTFREAEPGTVERSRLDR